jgi:hypothetical protein
MTEREPSASDDLCLLAAGLILDAVVAQEAWGKKLSSVPRARPAPPKGDDESQ